MEERIPRKIYKQLVDMMGKEEADQFLEECNYNLIDVSQKLFMYDGQKDRVNTDSSLNPVTIILIIIAIISLFGIIIFSVN